MNGVAIEGLLNLLSEKEPKDKIEVRLDRTDKHFGPERVEGKGKLTVTAMYDWFDAVGKQKDDMCKALSNFDSIRFEFVDEDLIKVTITHGGDAE